MLLSIQKLISFNADGLAIYIFLCTRGEARKEKELMILFREKIVKWTKNDKIDIKYFFFKAKSDKWCFVSK